MRDHNQLRAFQLADEIAILAYRVTTGFPKEEQFGLTAQLRRSVVFVPSNIVEGCARESKIEYLGFFDIAFGSLRELHYQIDLSNRLGFLTANKAGRIEPEITETENVLNS